MDRIGGSLGTHTLGALTALVESLVKLHPVGTCLTLLATRWEQAPSKPHAPALFSSKSTEDPWPWPEHRHAKTPQVPVLASGGWTPPPPGRRHPSQPAQHHTPALAPWHSTSEQAGQASPVQQPLPAAARVHAPPRQPLPAAAHARASPRQPLPAVARARAPPRQPLPLRLPPTSLTAAIQDWQAAAAGLLPVCWPPPAGRDQPRATSPSGPPATGTAAAAAAAAAAALAVQVANAHERPGNLSHQQHPERQLLQQYQQQLQQKVQAAAQAAAWYLASRGMVGGHAEQPQGRAEGAHAQGVPHTWSRALQEEQASTGLEGPMGGGRACGGAATHGAAAPALSPFAAAAAVAAAAASPTQTSISLQHPLFAAVHTAAWQDEDLLHMLLRALQGPQMQQLPLTLHLHVAFLLNDALLAQPRPIPTYPSLNPHAPACALSVVGPLHTTPQQAPHPPAPAKPSATSIQIQNSGVARAVRAPWLLHPLSPYSAGAAPQLCLDLGDPLAVATDAPVLVPPQGMGSFAYRHFFKDLEAGLLNSPARPLAPELLEGIARAFGTPHHAPFTRLWQWLTKRVMLALNRAHPPSPSSAHQPMRALSPAQLLTVVEAQAAAGVRAPGMVEAALAALWPLIQGQTLPPELWARLLPAMVRVLDPPQPSAATSHAYAPHDYTHWGAFDKPSMHPRVCREQLCLAARIMAPFMSPTLVIQAAVQLVGEPALPAELHALVTSQLHGCTQHLEPHQLVVLWKALIYKAMCGTSATMEALSGNSVPRDSRSSSSVSSSVSSLVQEDSFGRDRSLCDGPAQGGLKGWSDDGGAGLLKGLSSSVQQVLPRLPAHGVVEVVQVLAEAAGAKHGGASSSTGPQNLPDHLQQLVQPLCALIRHRLPDLTPPQLVPLLISLPRLIATRHLPHTMDSSLRTPQQRTMLPSSILQQQQQQQKQDQEHQHQQHQHQHQQRRRRRQQQEGPTESVPAALHAFGPQDSTGSSSGRVEELGKHARAKGSQKGTGSSSAAAAAPPDAGAGADAAYALPALEAGSRPRGQMDKEQLRLHAMQGILRQRLHQQLLKCDPAQLAEVVGRLAAAATAHKSTQPQQHPTPATRIRHSDILAGGVDVKLLQAAAAAAAHLLGVHAPASAAGEASVLGPAQQQYPSPVAQQQPQQHQPQQQQPQHHPGYCHRTLPALHQGISPVVACDLVRGFARLGLRHPQLYSAACRIVTQGLMADLDAWARVCPSGGVPPHSRVGGGDAGQGDPWASRPAQVPSMAPVADRGEAGQRKVLRGHGPAGTEAARHAQRQSSGACRIGEGSAAEQVGGRGGGGGGAPLAVADCGGSSGSSSSRDAWSAGVWVGSGGVLGSVGPSGLSGGGLVDLLGALAYVQHCDALLLDMVAQRLAVELE